MIARLFLAAAVLIVVAQASGTCSQRTLTAEMLPGPDRWHELPDANYEVWQYLSNIVLFRPIWEASMQTVCALKL